jgi:hypothetical protein
LVFIGLIGIITGVYVCFNIRKIAYYNRLIVLAFVFLAIAPSFLVLIEWTKIIIEIELLTYKVILIVFGLMLILGGIYSYIRGPEEHKRAIISYILAVVIMFVIGSVAIFLITL